MFPVNKENNPSVVHNKIAVIPKRLPFVFEFIKYPI